jgi:hypothetical protein
MNVNAVLSCLAKLHVHRCSARKVRLAYGLVCQVCAPDGDRQPRVYLHGRMLRCALCAHLGRLLSFCFRRGGEGGCFCQHLLTSLPCDAPLPSKAVMFEKRRESINLSITRFVVEGLTVDCCALCALIASVSDAIMARTWLMVAIADLDVHAELLAVNLHRVTKRGGAVDEESSAETAAEEALRRKRRRLRTMLRGKRLRGLCYHA